LRKHASTRKPSPHRWACHERFASTVSGESCFLTHGHTWTKRKGAIPSSPIPSPANQVHEAFQNSLQASDCSRPGTSRRSRSPPPRRSWLRKRSARHPDDVAVPNQFAAGRSECRPPCSSKRQPQQIRPSLRKIKEAGDRSVRPQGRHKTDQHGVPGADAQQDGQNQARGRIPQSRAEK
jgi:hypothetical protein